MEFWRSIHRDWSLLIELSKLIRKLLCAEYNSRVHHLVGSYLVASSIRSDRRLLGCLTVWGMLVIASTHLCEVVAGWLCCLTP